MSNYRSYLEYELLLFGFFSLISVRILGVIQISEIFAVATLPYSILFLFKNDNPTFKKVNILLLLWVLGLFISDWVNGVNLEKTMKGFFSIVVFQALLLYFNRVVSVINISMMRYYFLGFIFAGFLGLFWPLDILNREILAAEGGGKIADLANFGKMLYGLINMFILVYLGLTLYSSKTKLYLLLVIGCSLLGFYFGSRSLIVINSVSLFVHFFYYSRKPLYNNNFGLPLYKVLIGIVGMSMLFLSVYPKLASIDFFDERELHKFEKQSQSSIGILSGRGDFIIGIVAAMDAPFLGHGSYAEDNNNYKLLNQFLFDVEEDHSTLQKLEMIPSHSHLVGAWVFSGFLGLIFWIYVVWIHMRYIKRCTFYLMRYWFPLLFLVILNLWNILFSPFSQRPLLSLVIVVIVKISATVFEREAKKRSFTLS